LAKAVACRSRTLHEAVASLKDLPNDAVMVSVPLHRKKLRQRGFNQVESIAPAAISRESQPRQLFSNAIERQRETKSQIGLTSHQRRGNMRGEFVVAKPREVSGREVLLVDDVYTTRTTVSECARILRPAGASKVWVATVARTSKTSATFVEGNESEKSVAMAATG
jgi:ComF family protein